MALDELPEHKELLLWWAFLKAVEDRRKDDNGIDATLKLIDDYDNEG